MKLKALLKFVFVLAGIVFILKVQYREALSVKAIESVISHGYIQPSVPADPGSGGLKPSYQKDLIRFELLFIFLALLCLVNFSFSIFQVNPVRIRIPQKVIRDCTIFNREKGRAPPF